MRKVTDHFVVKLNEKHSATLKETGIEVGCQTFSYEAFERLKAAIESWAKRPVSMVVDSSKIYAGIDKSGDICVLVRRQYGSGKYYFALFSSTGESSLTSGNGYSHDGGCEVPQDAIREFGINIGPVYEFDYPAEFFDWARRNTGYKQEG